MGEVAPSLAAALADEVYEIRDEDFLSAFLSRPELSGKAGDFRRKNAKVGHLLWRSQDAFGIFVRGSGAYRNDLFLVFRGTSRANKKADWTSNANIGIDRSKTGLPVHAGFNRIFTSMLPGIRKFLANHTSATGTVHCVGHSLGGAVANLAADWIRKHKGQPVKLYTFGAPRPGGHWFARSMGSRLKESNIHRVYHKTDPVPMVPIFPFMHPPLWEYGYQIHSSESIVSAEAHGMGRYRKSVANQNWKNLHSPLAPYHIDHMVEQWLKSDTPPNRADSRVWEWINSAMIWVLKKIFMGTAVIVQSAFSGAFTLVDKLAWLLKSGIDMVKEGGYWVGRLMRKIMEVLGMAVVSTKELTQAFIRRILMRLMERMTQEVQVALRRAFGPRGS